MASLLTSAATLLRNGNSALLACAVFHLGLLLICFILGLLDGRMVAGVNPWLKPAKFCISVAVYCATLSIILGLIDGFTKMRLWVGRAVATLMFAEVFLITFQAARGVTSHYNVTSPLDGLIFAAMGILIGINTVLDSVVFGLFLLSPAPQVSTGALWGIRFGLVLFIAASFEGFVMIMNQAHTVGAEDGGAGVAWFNWSKEHGDLRVAHFLGLHALQILPLAGLLIDRFMAAPSARAAAISALSAGYGWLMWWQTKVALAGKPFLKL
jgi:hypothetical protein